MRLCWQQRAAKTAAQNERNKMKTIDKNYKAAWDRVFENLTQEEQDLVLASPDGRASCTLAMHAERLVEARANAKGHGAGAERQLMERLEGENPL
jgi:hypothetical protein